MKKRLLFLVALFCLAPLNLVMPQGELDSLKELPDLQRGAFRVDPYIRIAVKLQAMGKDKGTKTLLQFAKNRDYDNQVIVLCRMLFAQKDKADFRRPRIGAANSLGGTDYED